MQPVKPPSLLLPDPIQPLSTPVFDDGPILDSSMSTRTQATLPDPFQPSVSRSNSAPTIPNTPLLKRIFTLRRGTIVPVPEFGATIEEVQAEAEKEFLRWLLGELKKCEDFYLLREIECVKRFDEMREQLDIMRDRWFKAKHNIPFEEDDVEDLAEESTPEGSGSEADNATFTAGDRSEGHKKRVGWKSFADTMNGLMRSGTTTSQVDTGVMHAPADENRDYVRRTPARKPLNNPVHRVAKHKLKRAYIEYYHGLEMLKSYVTVNRECFRKITKKFDKASGLRTSHRFMTEYVDKSLFGSANNDLDELLNDTESLFARFFERGNRKEASARLRSRENKTLYYGSVWKSGFYLGASSIIGAYGVYQAVLKLKDGSDPARALRTSYLLQVTLF